jgi:hypothetical protein
VPFDLASPLAAAAALQFALGAPPPAADVIWVHVCGNDRLVPLPQPAGKDRSGQRPCHGGSAITAE